MVQQGQVFRLTARGSDGERLWAFRYRTGGRDSRRVQRGGFATEQDARAIRSSVSWSGFVVNGGSPEG